MQRFIDGKLMSPKVITEKKCKNIYEIQTYYQIEPKKRNPLVQRVNMHSEDVPDVGSIYETARLNTVSVWN